MARPFDTGSFVVIPILVRRLGVLEALRVMVDTARALARGEPFAHLPAATDARERASRAQAGPAIVLYRALQARGHAEAHALVGEVVEAAAVHFLRRSIGPVRPAELARLSEAEQKAWVDSRAARFPNAKPVFEVVTAHEVRFRVDACRFVGLSREAGAPELATVFCRGDARFFGGVEKGLALERPHTLAEGGPDCPFTIRARAP